MGFPIFDCKNMLCLEYRVTWSSLIQLKRDWWYNHKHN